MEHIMAKLVEDFEQGRIGRRQFIKSLALAATAASAVSAAAAPVADNKLVKATYINHVSYQVPDYTKIRDLYAGVFGMEISEDDGKNCRLTFGNNILIPRNPGVRAGGGDQSTGVDHISYTIENWDTDKNVALAMEDNLKKRGVKYQKNNSGGMNFVDPYGLRAQIGGKRQ